MIYEIGSVVRWVIFILSFPSSVKLNVRNIMEEGEVIYHSVAYVVCPYCGAEECLSNVSAQDKGVIRCDECMKEFSFTTEI